MAVVTQRVSTRGSFLLFGVLVAANAAFAFDAGYKAPTPLLAAAAPSPASPVGGLSSQEWAQVRGNMEVSRHDAIQVLGENAWRLVNREQGLVGHFDESGARLNLRGGLMPHLCRFVPWG